MSEDVWTEIPNPHNLNPLDFSLFLVDYIQPFSGQDTFTFPENGKFPYIIACDQSVQWMKELKSIPRSWFSTNPPKSYDDYNNGSHGGGIVIPNSCTEGTSIWSGNMPLNWDNQKVENAFSSVNNNDVLHFHFSVTDEANAKVDIHLGNGWVGIANKDLSTCATKYCITYTVTDKSKLDQGIVFQGQDCVLTGITVVPAYVAQQTDATLGETINFAITDWADAVKISSSQLSGIAAGDKIVVALSDIQGDAQIQVKEMADGWKYSIVAARALATNETALTINVTNENIDRIKNGIAIQGYGFTVVSVSKVDAVKHTITVTAGENGTVTGGGSYAEGSTVTLTATPASGYRVKAWYGGSAEGKTTNSVQVTVGDSDATYSVEFEESSEDTIWEGNHQLGWSGDGQFQLTNQNLSNGDVVRVYYTANNNGTLQIFQIVGSWDTKIEKSVNSGDGYIDYNITKTATGIAVQGDNSITITKITKQ